MSREQLSELYSQSTLWLKRLELHESFIHSCTKFQKTPPLVYVSSLKENRFMPFHPFQRKHSFKLHVSKTKWTYDKLCSRSTLTKFNSKIGFNVHSSCQCRYLYFYKKNLFTFLNFLLTGMHEKFCLFG